MRSKPTESGLRSSPGNDMQVVFISNFINHHQLPFCNALKKRLGDDFIFTQSEPMEEERVAMGWDVNVKNISYVKCFYDDEKLCRDLILNADVLIAGWTDKIDIVMQRMSQRKLTIRISERIYREGQWKAISPRGLISKYREHIRYRNYPVYLLCAGAYVASDFNLIKAYPNKMYKFGYFPQTMKYHLDKLFAMKDSSGMIEIIFAGRFMKLKHPEYMIWLARDLKEENEKRAQRDEPLLPNYRIHMVGAGELEHPLRTLVTKYGLLDQVIFYGYQSPEKVRTLMERCHIHVFPSDELEGWGAVVNEAMNSGCAVVASADAGAVPYLIKQWENGVMFPGNNYDKMKDAVIYLMTHGREREEMANKAYHTILDSWNADNVVDTLLYMIEGWKEGLNHPPLEGPLSKAPVISPGNMFQLLEGSGTGKERTK